MPPDVRRALGRHQAKPASSRLFFAPDAARVALGAAALLGALPFLFPEHGQPIRSFYDEWTAIALATAAIGALALKLRAADAEVPELSLWLAAFAGWLGVQAAVREPAYLQLPLAGIACALLAAQLVWLGHRLGARFGPQTVADVLAAIVLAGAAANAVIGIVQFYGVPRALSGFIGATVGRVVGHVGQSNLFADYLALGQASLLYLLARGRLAGRWAWIAGALLALGSAYSQSRSAILFSVWLCALALYARGNGPSWQRMARHALLLASASLALMVTLPRMHEAVGFQSPLFAIDRLLDIGTEPRFAAWALALRLFAGSPWLGVGWGEFAGAAFHEGLPAKMGVYGSIWATPHNFLLQVLAETGLVGAALLFIAALRWWHHAWQRLRREPVMPEWWIAAVVGTVCLHALLEEPFSYAHVMALVAFVAGIAGRRAAAMPARPLRLGLVAVNVAACVLLAWALFDYQRLARSYVLASGRTLAGAAQVTEAFDELKAAAHGPLGVHVAFWLYASPAFHGGKPADVLDAGERVLRRWPGPTIIARLAAAHAAAGNEAQAARLVKHAWATVPADRQRLALALARAGAQGPWAILPAHDEGGPEAGTKRQAR